MPRVFDNIEQSLLPALRESLLLFERADFCVGYFNLRGWKQIDGCIERWSGGEGQCCRLLVGMQRLPQEELRDALSVLQTQDAIDNQTALRWKRRLAEEFREQPYAISDDFTYKRPHGFILDGQASTGVTIWRRLFELIRQQLQRSNPERFRKLPEHPDFITRRGHPSFSRDPQALCSAGLIGDGIHAEINLSANHICATIRRLLATLREVLANAVAHRDYSPYVRGSYVQVRGSRSVTTPC